MSAKINTASEVSMNELLPLMLRCFRVQRPLFMWAGPGVGKSSVIGSVAKILKGISVDMRLSQMQPTDITGIPYFDKGEGNPGDSNYRRPTMKWAPPELLPSEEFAKEFPLVILFLDEMNSAPPAVQAAAYQLVLDRRAGAYKLPDNVVIVAAGNRDSDRGVTYRMPAPLANRFLHFDIKVDFDSWLDWAVPAGIHPDVMSYLSNYKSHLYQFDSTSADKSFPTPRSWEFVSQLLWTNTEQDPMTDGEIREMVGAAIGGGVATTFMGHLKIGKTLPKAADVLSGKVKTISTKEVSAHYQLIMAMLYELGDFWNSNSVGLGTTEKLGTRQIEKRAWNDAKKQTEFTKMLDNFYTFILVSCELEVGVMAAKMSLANYHFGRAVSKLGELGSWSKMSEKYFKHMRDFL